MIFKKSGKTSFKRKYNSVDKRQFIDLDEDVSIRHSVDKYYNLNDILPVSTSQFLDLDVFLRHSVDEFYNLNDILPVGMRQFLDLDEDVSLRHSVDEYYNLNGILR